MKNREIKDILDRIIIELTDGLISIYDLNEDTDLMIDAYFDSITMVQCIIEIEEAFKIEFDEDVILLENIKNYKWLVNYIEDKLKNKEKN